MTVFIHQHKASRWGNDSCQQPHCLLGCPGVSGSEPQPVPKDTGPICESH